MKISSKVSVAIACAALSSEVLATSGCGSTTFQSFLNTLETDLANGTALSDLQSVVVQFFPSLVGQTQAIAAVLQAAINLLISSGVLTIGSAANASSILIQIRTLQMGVDSGTTNLDRNAEQILAEIRGGKPMSKHTAAFVGSIKRSL